VTGDDSGLLVVTGSVASQLEDLSCEVLHDGGHVDGGTGTNALSIVALPQQTVDTSDGELESSTAGPGLCLSLNFASFASSRHVDSYLVQNKLCSNFSRENLYTPPWLQLSTNGKFSLFFPHTI